MEQIGVDELMWSWDLTQPRAGEFSFTMVQGNDALQDHNQVETVVATTFIGVYDNLGGVEASCFISNHLCVHTVCMCLSCYSLA
jgi:pyruvate dehydrogenase phosphatase